MQETNKSYDVELYCPKSRYHKTQLRRSDATLSHWLAAPTLGPRAASTLNLREKFTEHAAHRPTHAAMASTTRRLLLQPRRSALSLPRRATPHYPAQWQQAQRAALSTTPARSARSRDDDDEHQQRRPEKPKPPVKNSPEQEKAQLKQFAQDFGQMDPSYWKEAQRKGQTGIPILPNAELLPDEFDELPESAQRVKQGFWAEGEESMGPDEDYYADDITSDGDGVLQQHRYLRKYARLVAWELPLLSRTYSPHPPGNLHTKTLRTVC